MVKNIFVIGDKYVTTITSPKIALAIIESHPSTKSLCSGLKGIINQVKAYYEAEKDRIKSEGKQFLGIHFSSSLFDDATDNIFYLVHVGEVQNGGDFYAEVRFVHNATQLFTGLKVTPADVQEVDTTSGKYSFACINNITFPRHLSHLLYQALDKLAIEMMAPDFKTLANVAILETTHDTFR
jgi:hypothetical protein